MSSSGTREPAREPNDLARFFIERANAGDAEGLALYEPDAVLALPDGRTAVGREAIREFYARLLSTGRKFEAGVQRPALRQGGLALTSYGDRHRHGGGCPAATRWHLAVSDRPAIHRGIDSGRL
jgi:ketosteroid isomerase-like protein